MRILAVDDEQLMLDALTDSISKAAPQAEIQAFKKSRLALAYAEEHKIDVAFLDIQMRGMNGMELARKLLEKTPEMNIIFCTSFDEYVSEAFRDVRCNGYITKPVDEEQIRKELEHLRQPMTLKMFETSHQKSNPIDINQLLTGFDKRVYIQCLGRFEVFVNNQPLQFKSMKTKELLAYLVHACGGICGNQEIIAALWDDDNHHDSYYKKIRKDLVTTLSHYGCSDVLIRHRGGMGINLNEVDCDYYKWREINPGETPKEYMVQYIWANIPEYEW